MTTLTFNLIAVTPDLWVAPVSLEARTKRALASASSTPEVLSTLLEWLDLQDLGQPLQGFNARVFRACEQRLKGQPLAVWRQLPCGPALDTLRHLQAISPLSSSTPVRLSA